MGGEGPSSRKNVNPILDQTRALDNVRVDYGDDDNRGIRIPIHDVYFCCGLVKITMLLVLLLTNMISNANIYPSTR